VLVGTIFENTKIPLQKWFLAMYFAINDKKGVSSCQLAKNIGVTQKSAWFMLHRIREMLREKAPHLLSGEVETDETYIGGKEGWKHNDKRYRKTHGRSTQAKTPVYGIVERGTGHTIFQVVEDSKQETIQPILRSSVKPGSTIHSDEWVAYQGLSPMYRHEIVKHRVKEYVRGSVHTNTIENRWSHLKRTLTGTYHQVSRKHLNRYAQECAFRLNTRDAKGGQRFDRSLTNCEGRLTYSVLTGK
jgi:transposase-like protein